MNPLEVCCKNTQYFINEKNYKWNYSGKYLEKENKRIDISNVYEFSEVDEFGRRLFIQIIKK